jgi:hypothetical protein
MVHEASHLQNYKHGVWRHDGKPFSGQGVFACPFLFMAFEIFGILHSGLLFYEILHQIHIKMNIHLTITTNLPIPHCSSWLLKLNSSTLIPPVVVVVAARPTTSLTTSTYSCPHFRALVYTS